MGCCVTRETNFTDSKDLNTISMNQTIPPTPKSPHIHKAFTPPSRPTPSHFEETPQHNLPSQSESHSLPHSSQQVVSSPIKSPNSSSDSLKTSSSNEPSCNEISNLLSPKQEITFPHTTPETYQDVHYRANLEERISPRSQDAKIIFPGLEETPGDMLSYGDIIILTHKNTWNSLYSHNHHYMSGSMGQQVVCLSDRNDNDMWKICRASKDEKENDAVRYGTVIRLKHIATKAYLSSSEGVPSPYSNQQEITCDKQASEKCDWIMEPTDEFLGEEWTSDHDIKLKHAQTGKYIQSGDIHFNLGHGNLQEVFGSDQSEGDEVWIIELKTS
jgi:hypothetical protein